MGGRLIEVDDDGGANLSEAFRLHLLIIIGNWCGGKIVERKSTPSQLEIL